MRTPSSAFPAAPHGLADGGGNPATPFWAASFFAAGFFAAGFFATAFTVAFFGVGLPVAAFLAAGLLTTFFAAVFVLAGALVLACGLVLAFAFLRVAIAVPLSLFLAKHALRIEIADAAALAAGGRVDHRVDEGRLAGVHRRVHGALELVRRRRVDADAAESFHHLVVARTLDEDGGGDVRSSGGIDVGSAVDAVIVEDDNAHRKVIPADRFHFHAGKAEGAVALHGEHGLA